LAESFTISWPAGTRPAEGRKVQLRQLVHEFLRLLRAVERSDKKPVGEAKRRGPGVRLPSSFGAFALMRANSRSIGRLVGAARNLHPMAARLLGFGRLRFLGGVGFLCLIRLFI
jgi:hypothetical protein